jgi:hypothetical protein
MIFIEDHGFQRRRKGLMDDEELFRLLEWLAVHPELGKVIPASGGLRKVRWAGKGHGKRGGTRVIYFWWMSDDRILLLDIYAKGEQENLGAAEIEKLRQKVIL